MARRNRGRNGATQHVAEQAVAVDPELALLETRLKKYERAVLSESLSWLDNYVDPSEAYYDSDGTRFMPIGGSGEGMSPLTEPVPYRNETELDLLLRESRWLALTNEFAINAIENRISYVVGKGHKYTAVWKQGCEPAELNPDEVSLDNGPVDTPDDLPAQVQAVIDDFVRRNKWHSRQAETQRRLDRDGEVFRRFFTDDAGNLIARFVEPGEVKTPNGNSDPSVSYGIETDPDDVETVRKYHIGGDPVEADEVQHLKANVDSNCKRGVSLFYPVRQNLRRAERLLRNMAAVAEIQSAIAMIRKHAQATSGGVQNFVAGKANRTVTDSATGNTSRFQHFGPGTILDARLGSMEYEFPTTGIDAAKFVTMLQAVLRTIASRLVMPEFMLSSDASNANYSSTLVAEGPAVKMFERLQETLVEADLEVMRRAVALKISKSELPEDTLERIKIEAEPPRVATRNVLEEIQADSVLYDRKIMSPQHFSAKWDLDYEQEQQNIDRHAEQHPAPDFGFGFPPTGIGPVGGQLNPETLGG